MKFALVLALAVGCRTAEAGPSLQLSQGSLQAPPVASAARGSRPTVGGEELAAKTGVLVELFTSEGCSSCPPADEVLADLARNADAESQNVIPIAFHVDYWNQLGWEDPFSLAESSERQRWYAQVFHTTRIYTPQMIVGGTHAFVGSNRRELERNLTDASSEDPTAAFRLHLTGGEACADCGQTRTVSLKLDEPEGNEGLLIALVQQQVTSRVTRGENSGSELEHRNVVRAFTWRERPNRLNSWRFELPNAPAGGSYSLVAFVQRLSDGQVSSAEQWALPD